MATFAYQRVTHIFQMCRYTTNQASRPAAQLEEIRPGGAMQLKRLLKGHWALW